MRTVFRKSTTSGSSAKHFHADVKCYRLVRRRGPKKGVSPRIKEYPENYAQKHWTPCPDCIGDEHEEHS